jgi:hypothetical protein
MKKEYYLNLILLCLNLLLLAAQPIILSVGNSFWALGLLTLLLFVGVWLNKWNAKDVTFKLIIVFFNIICSWFYFSYDTNFTKLCYILSIIILMVYSLVIQFNIVLNTKKADATIIFSSINFYLLAGYTAACVVWMAETISPSSFVINHPVNSHQLFDFVYFSFVTMATLGYGDIIPSNELGKTIAVFISLFGQLFVSVFLVITLSKYIKNKDD